MYNSSIYIHFKPSSDNQNIVKMFFEDWADRICQNNIKYSVVRKNLATEIIKLDFGNEEDATAMMLKGIPVDLQRYFKIVDSA